MIRIVRQSSGGPESSRLQGSGAVLSVQKRSALAEWPGYRAVHLLFLFCVHRLKFNNCATSIYLIQALLEVKPFLCAGYLIWSRTIGRLVRL